MAAELGNINKCYIGASVSQSTTYTLLAGENTNSVNITANAIEVSDKSHSWQQFIAGVRGGSADVTVYADNSDAQQKSLLSSFGAGSTVSVFIGQLSGSTPSKGIAFTAVITAISDTNDNGAASTRNLTLTITGVPTFYPTA